MGSASMLGGLEAAVQQSAGHARSAPPRPATAWSAAHLLVPQVIRVDAQRLLHGHKGQQLDQVVLQGGRGPRREEEEERDRPKLNAPISELPRPPANRGPLAHPPLASQQHAACTAAGHGICAQAGRVQRGAPAQMHSPMMLHPAPCGNSDGIPPLPG